MKTMSRLPLKLRMDLRDQWEDVDCPAQKSIAALEDLLGLAVLIQLEPLVIWNALRDFYPDHNNFLPSITSVVQSWVVCLTRILADDTNSVWTEQFLDYVNRNGRNLKARVETQPGSQVRTEIVKGGATLIIGIPESWPPYKNTSGFFMSDFEKLFTQSSNQISSAQTQGAEDEDWANVSLQSRTHRQTSGVAPTAMPSLDEVPRPETLFAEGTPYHLIVKIVHNGIVVQGSHQGSLELLAGYFQKYMRDIENSSVRLPTLKFELQVSHIGYGGLFDMLTITSGDPRGVWTNINPVLILSFVESVLGYIPVASGSSESQWYYKRDVPFKAISVKTGSIPPPAPGACFRSEAGN